ncbi:MAG: hypothetical protein U1F46_09880 [Marinagarivorans sp.]
MKNIFVPAAVLGSLLLTGCTGQQSEKPPATTPPVTSPPVTNSRIKINSITFKDESVAYYMRVISAGNPDMYADEVTYLALDKATDLSWLPYFSQLKVLTVSGQVHDRVDLASNPLLETLDIKADSLLLSHNNRLRELTAQVSHIELPSTAALTVLNLTHSPVIGPQSKELYRSNKNPLLANHLKLDLSRQPKLQQLYLSGSFEEVILPSTSVLEYLTIKGSATARLNGLAQQAALKRLDVVLDKNLQEVDVSGLKRLEYLALKADGIHSLDISALPQLDVLEINGDNFSQLASNTSQPSLHHLRLMAPKIYSLDLNPYQNLNTFFYADGDLAHLNASLPNLTDITIGNAPLVTLKTGSCSALAHVEIGYNLLDQLDLSQCKSLTEAFILPSTARTEDVLNTQLKLPQGVERVLSAEARLRISALTQEHIPDARLLACAQAAGKAENALYVQQLKNITCRGENSKAYYQAFASLQEGRADPLVNNYIFDLTGLSLFTGLQNLDLGTNWISQLNLNGLNKLKRLVADGNIIQDADFSNPVLQQVDLSSNPLVRVVLPEGLEQFKAAAGINSNAYVSYILGNYGLDILRRGPEGKLLSVDDFSKKLNAAGWPVSLTDIQSNRVTWPSISLPGAQRLRFADVNIEDKNLKDCIQEDFVYADEVKSLSCQIRGGLGGYVIRSFKGLEQLSNLEDAFLYGLDLRAADLSPLKNLKKLTIGDSQIGELNFGHLPALEEFSLNNFGVVSSPNLTLDLAQNTYLRRLNASGIGQIKLPESDSLEFLTLRTAHDSISTDNKYPDLDLSHYTHLYKVDIDNRVGVLTLPASSKLDSLSCFRCKPQQLLNLNQQERLTKLSFTAPSEWTQLDLANLPRLNSLNLEAPNLQGLNLAENLRLSELILNAPQLTQLRTPAVSGLTGVQLTAPKLTQLNTAAMPKLLNLTVNEHGFKQLDLSASSQLKQLQLGDGMLQLLTLGDNRHLADVNIGAGKIKALDFSRLSALKNLRIGRNPLQSLDLQANTALMSLSYTEPAPANMQLPTLDFDLPVIIEPAVKKIQELTQADVPDELLRKCIMSTALKQGIEFVDELTELSCRGLDSKDRTVAMSHYASGESLKGYACCIFDLKGLRFFYNLRTIDFTGNWISNVLFEDINLPKLNSLNLDHNAIQTLALLPQRGFGGSIFTRSIRNLSLNANPLSHLILPFELQYLAASAGDDWIYTQAVIASQYKKEPMLDWVTRSPLTMNEYKRPFTVDFYGEMLFIDSPKYAR